ncbi:hypothetical protein WR25_26397 [Diploscapter pachys]|uniref:Uncharacterized protein n=1 Tax=Diploscapter pachys TaxID=2018661 RepID=A0A2A2M287_9BILA|nr:hypothetical protein WR25_26397 [Diploscapter pachys]
MASSDRTRAGASAGSGDRDSCAAPPFAFGIVQHLEHVAVGAARDQVRAYPIGISALRKPRIARRAVRQLPDPVDPPLLGDEPPAELLLHMTSRFAEQNRNMPPGRSSVESVDRQAAVLPLCSPHSAMRTLSATGHRRAADARLQRPYGRDRKDGGFDAKGTAGRAGARGVFKPGAETGGSGGGRTLRCSGTSSGPRAGCGQLAPPGAGKPTLRLVYDLVRKYGQVEMHEGWHAANGAGEAALENNRVSFDSVWQTHCTTRTVEGPRRIL